MVECVLTRHSNECRSPRKTGRGHIQPFWTTPALPLKQTISSFIEETNPEDRLLLRGQISELLAFETENDRRRYLRLMGAAYWPPNETVEGVFRDALQLIEDRS